MKALSHSCCQFFTNKEVKILVHQKLQCENSGTSQLCYLVTPVSVSAGLPQTKLGNFLETRVNDYIKRQNHPESGEVTIRVVHVSDKVVEVKPGMKSR